MSENRSKPDQYQLRFPPGLRDRIKAAADGNGRSMNAEIVATLEDAYPNPDQLRQELNFVNEIDEIQQRLFRLRMAQMKESLDEHDEAIRKADALLEKPEED